MKTFEEIEQRIMREKGWTEAPSNALLIKALDEECDQLKEYIHDLEHSIVQLVLKGEKL